MTSTFDLFTMGRSSIDLYANDVGSPFVDIKSFAVSVGGSPTNIAIGSQRLNVKTACLEGRLYHCRSLCKVALLYDVGHAQTLDVLGFYRHEDWLERFAPRIIGTHLHDVVGTTDHFAPGMGSMDFDMVAAYLPEHAFRTCEFQTFDNPEQVKAGLRVLVEHGCIKLHNE